MFVWFIFRDSTAQTWFSGLETASGAKKPAYNAFAAAAKAIVGQIAGGRARKTFSVKVPFPIMAYYNAPGTKVGVTYKILIGQEARTRSASRCVDARARRYGHVTVNFKPVEGQDATR